MNEMRDRKPETLHPRTKKFLLDKCKSLKSLLGARLNHAQLELEKAKKNEETERSRLAALINPISSLLDCIEYGEKPTPQEIKDFMQWYEKNIRDNKEYDHATRNIILSIIEKL